MKYTGRCENDFNACGYRRADRQPVSHGGLDRGVVDLGVTPAQPGGPSVHNFHWIPGGFNGEWVQSPGQGGRAAPPAPLSQQPCRRLAGGAG
jgi:hypothetical protein